MKQREARACVKQPAVQILVVVANIQMRTLKTEVGKGSRGTAVGPGLVGPKRGVSSENGMFGPAPRKGIWSIFQNRSGEMAATQMNLETPTGALERVFFSC